MEIEYLKLIKIDHENNNVQEEPLHEEGNVRDYVMDIIGQITDNAGERRYEFKDGELTMKTWIGDIVNDNERDNRAMNIARRLLEKEDAAQQRYHNITDIQKGILLLVRDATLCAKVHVQQLFGHRHAWDSPITLL